MSVIGNKPCFDSRKCFARGLAGGCTILATTYTTDGACKFCKPDRSITNGKYYPFKANYGGIKDTLLDSMGE